MQATTPKSEQIAQFRAEINQQTQHQEATNRILQEQNTKIEQLVQKMAQMQGQLDAYALAHRTHTHSFTQVTGVKPMIDFPNSRGPGGAALPARDLDLTPENSNGRAFLQVVTTPSKTSAPQ